MSTTRMQLSCAASLLDQGRALDRLSRLLTAAALIGMLVYPAAVGRPPLALAVAAIVIAVAGLGESYFAIRVGFDAALFRRLAGEPEQQGFGEMDGALTELGWLPPVKRDRPAPVRIAGAVRLMKLQALALLAQVVSCAGGGAALMWR